MLIDPTLKDLYTETSEEYYGDMYGYTETYDELDLDEECPDWVQQQLDEEMPFQMYGWTRGMDAGNLASLSDWDGEIEHARFIVLTGKKDEIQTRVLGYCIYSTDDHKVGRVYSLQTYRLRILYDITKG